MGPCPGIQLSPTEGQAGVGQWGGSVQPDRHFVGLFLPVGCLGRCVGSSELPDLGRHTSVMTGWTISHH